jgi:hypothetical protein
MALSSISELSMITVEASEQDFLVIEENLYKQSNPFPLHQCSIAVSEFSCLTYTFTESTPWTQCCVLIPTALVTSNLLLCNIEETADVIRQEF